MTNRYRLWSGLAALVLLCCAALILGQKVNAAGEGTITGTVKLDGAAPHMRASTCRKTPSVPKPTPTIPHIWRPW